MTSWEDDDQLIHAVATLPRVGPDEASACALRARCRARLEQPGARMPVMLEPAAVGSVCVLYAWQVAELAIRSSGG